MPSEKELARSVADRLKLVSIPDESIFDDAIILDNYKKLFNYKSLEQILPAGEKSLHEAARALDNRQSGLVVACVNHGVFAREKLPSVLEKIIKGWQKSPMTIDARILKLISMQNMGKMGQKFTEKIKKAQETDEDCEINVENYGKTIEPGKMGATYDKYLSIEDAGGESGFSVKFLDRIKEYNDEYRLEVADKSMLRLLVSTEIHLENLLARQSRSSVTFKKLKMTEAMQTTIKNCLETLKLARRQRRVENDDTTEKDIEKKYEENRNIKKDIDKGEQDVVDRSKAAILEFANEVVGDEDDYELCPTCLNTECDGSCEDLEGKE